MNEQPIVTQKRTDYFKVSVVICLVVLAGVVGWLVYRTEDIGKRNNTVTTTESEKNTTEDMTNTSWNTVVKSGSGGFELTLPDGWGPITRDLKSDFIVLPGTAQPTIQKGKDVQITDVEGYGTDSLSLFSAVMLQKGTAAAPQGEASEFVIGKAEDAITGQKYVYTFPKDEVIGIGHTRFQGDRDYEYVFPFGDKELHVYYHVYGSDPRNLSETVDEIVRTIILAKSAPADL